LDVAVTTVDPSRSLFHFTPGEPYEYLKDLRENCPVYFDPILQGQFITRYSDVYEVMFNAARFRLQARPGEAYDEHQSKDRVVTFRKLLNFKTITPHVDTIIKPELDRLMDKLIAGGETGKAELYRDLCDPFPAHVIGLLFGLNHDDLPDLVRYRNARAAFFNAPPDDFSALEESQKWQARVDERMREVIAAQRAEPKDNLLQFLLTVEEDGKLLSDEDLIQICVRDILMAGSETATRSIANAAYRLLTLPGVYQQLLDDRSLVKDFLEESLRYDPPVHIFWRAANRDDEISGCPIAKDAQLYTSIASANRDPEMFPDPDKFDIARAGGKHVTFSVGPHLCPGAWVGRNELNLAITALLDRLPNLRLDTDEEPPQLTEVILRNWVPLHVRFDA
jgi:cytochrome P450